RHAAARVEHDDDRHRLDGIFEQRHRLLLAVVVDLEIVFIEVGDQPAILVLHRRVQRDRARAGTKNRLLTRQKWAGQEESGGSSRKVSAGHTVRITAPYAGRCKKRTGPGYHRYKTTW